ncbi:MAG: hypothetical protein AAB865_00545 [Patescibacteria group bacterium]
MKKLVIAAVLILVGLGPMRGASALTIHYLSIDTPSPTTVPMDTPVTISASYSGNIDPVSCALMLDGTSYFMDIDTSTSTLSQEFLAFSLETTIPGTYIHCLDEDGDSYDSETVTITVSSDTEVPQVGAFGTTSAVVGTEVNFRVSVSDNVEVTSCQLYVDGSLVGAMGVYYIMSSGSANLDHTFSTAGDHTAQVTCEDEHENEGENALTTITVTDVTTSGLLIKLQCGATVYVNDPCTAVYFYGSDGYRHAFPNEHVYMSWYDDYDDVLTVSSSYLAAIPLGANVTYRPGVKMVKFITDATVYAVSQGGELRAVASETVADDLYGSAWNQQIDDVSDVFYSNYHFGTDINSSTDYDRKAEMNAVTSINQNW